MKTKSIFFLFLKIYAIFWTIVGIIYLYSGITVLQQGKFEFSPFTLSLLIGIGLLWKNRFSWLSWQSALTMSFVILVFNIFLFLMAVASKDFGTSTVGFNWSETSGTEIPAPIFYPVSFCFWIGQIWVLLSKPIGLSFAYKTNATFVDEPDTIRDLKAENRIDKRKSLLRTNLIVICPKCKTRVLPKIDGICPSCQAKISAKSIARVKSMP
jgi:hypothetical protein